MTKKYVLFLCLFLLTGCVNHEAQREAGRIEMEASDREMAEQQAKLQAERDHTKKIIDDYNELVGQLNNDKNTMIMIVDTLNTLTSPQTRSSVINDYALKAKLYSSHLQEYLVFIEANQKILENAGVDVSRERRQTTDSLILLENNLIVMKTELEKSSQPTDYSQLISLLASIITLI